MFGVTEHVKLLQSIGARRIQSGSLFRGVAHQGGFRTSRAEQGDRTGQRTGAPVGPAGTTVLGDVLVPCAADVVHSTHVPPVPGLGELHQVHELVRTRGRSVEIPEDRRHETLITTAER